MRKVTPSRRALLASLAASPLAAAALPSMAAASAASSPEGRPAALEDYAAIDFEPWKHVEGEWTPPLPKEWAELFNPYGVTIRIAWEIAHETKAKLMEIVKATTDDDGRHLMKSFIDTESFFKGTLVLLEAAQVRYLCAGSTVELSEQEGEAADV